MQLTQTPMLSPHGFTPLTTDNNKFMRPIILSIAILFITLPTEAAGQLASNNSVNMSNLLLIAADNKSMIDSWNKGATTNGLICGVAFAPASEKGSPIFYVNIINTTTNWIRGYLNLPFEALASIALFDADGKSVSKTIVGQRVGTWTQKQVEDWFMEIYRKRTHAMTESGSITSTLWPLLPAQVSGEISIFQMFQIKQAGEYTLHLRMRFVRVEKDASGNRTFSTIWLPEVTAKVQILPQDIPPENLPTSSQTNSPAN
jgi:hypothetical protein